MLSLSSSLANFGYLIGISMFFIGAGNLYLGLYCFKYLMFKYPKTKVYSDLVREILGKKWEIIVNWIFTGYVFLSLIAYILVSKLKSLKINTINNQRIFKRF